MRLTARSLFYVLAVSVSIILLLNLGKYVNIVYLLGVGSSPYTYSLWQPFCSDWPFSPCIRRDWNSQYDGWYNRATLLNDTSGIHLMHKDIVLSASASSWGEEHFRLAIFKPGYCITLNAVLALTSEDFEGFTKLSAVAAASKNDAYYDLCPGVSDMSTSRLNVPLPNGAECAFFVYSFDKPDLRKGADWLPDVLWELFGLLKDRETWKGPGVDERLKKEFEQMPISGTEPAVYYEVDSGVSGGH